MNQHQTEGSATAIIVGILAVAFVFVLVFFIFGTVFYKMHKRRNEAATMTVSYEMSANDLPRAPNAGEVESGVDRSHAMHVCQLLLLLLL